MQKLFLDKKPEVGDTIKIDGNILTVAEGGFLTLELTREGERPDDLVVGRDLSETLTDSFSYWEECPNKPTLKIS